MGYRPLKIKGLNEKGKNPVGQLIDCVEKYLYDFAQTDSFDSGHRLSEVEAYLQGIKDARYVLRRNGIKI